MKRIIPCLDVKDGRVVKGVKFEGLSEVASPVDLAKQYSDSGADELVFYDITASIEGRQIFADLLTQVIKCITVPLTVGGGINELQDIERMLHLGADKVSINTGALKDPELIKKAASEFGSRRIVFAADVKYENDMYTVFTHGGQESTGINAIEWIKRAEQLGAGELVINSIDTDGVRSGFDLPLLKEVVEAVSIPVVASGGAGSIDDFITLFQALPKIDAGLAASIFHFGLVKIPKLKQELYEKGINVHI